MLALNIAWSSLSRTPVDVAGTYLPASVAGGGHLAIHGHRNGGSS
jgi:hypothetical protein